MGTATINGDPWGARAQAWDAVTDALRKALDPFVGLDGTVRLENTFRFVIARVG